MHLLPKCVRTQRIQRCETDIFLNHLTAKIHTRLKKIGSGSLTVTGNNFTCKKLSTTVLSDRELFIVCERLSQRA